MADQEHNWKCVQCFGDRGDSDDITDGNYLGTLALFSGSLGDGSIGDVGYVFFSRLLSREQAEYGGGGGWRETRGVEWTKGSGIVIVY